MSLKILSNDRAIDQEETNNLEQIKNKIIERLKLLGAKEQLLMFISGPAGAGKSTSITVAQRFCFEFCRALGMVWCDETFLFTAMTGVAAAIFGGTTIHSVGHLNSKKKNISEDQINFWGNVKILIIDEISMATTSQMNKLNDRLNMYKRYIAHEGHSIQPDMVFGGYSIIFSGDFRQIPPVNAKESELLYRNPGLWENAINVAIMLQNSHRFNNDPCFGGILRRMWSGTFTKEDFPRKVHNKQT